MPAPQLTLAKSQAEWILDSPSVGFICDEPVETPPTPPATPPRLAARELPPTLSKNQRKKAHRKAARGASSPVDLFGDTDDCCREASLHLTTSDHLARLRAYLVPPSTLPTSISTSTWTTTIASLFRLVILRTPALAPLALDPAEGAPLTSVDAFLDLLEDRVELKCGAEISALWMGLKFQKTSTGTGKNKDLGLLGISVLGDAIRDAFRKEEEGGMHIELLGGKVFKEPSKAEMPGQGWDLFYQFVSPARGLCSRR